MSNSSQDTNVTTENVTTETATPTSEQRLTLSVKRVRTHVRGGTLARIPAGSIVLTPGGSNLTATMSATPVSIWTNSSGVF